MMIMGIDFFASRQKTDDDVKRITTALIPDHTSVKYDIREMPDVYVHSLGLEQEYIARLIALMVHGPTPHAAAQRLANRYQEELRLEAEVRNANGFVVGVYEDGHIIEVQEVPYFDGLIRHLENPNSHFEDEDEDDRSF